MLFPLFPSQTILYFIHCFAQTIALHIQMPRLLLPSNLLYSKQQLTGINLPHLEVFSYLSSWYFHFFSFSVYVCVTYVCVVYVCASMGIHRGQRKILWVLFYQCIPDSLEMESLTESGDSVAITSHGSSCLAIIARTSFLHGLEPQIQTQILLF